MTMAYVRERYGVPVRRGQTVRIADVRSIRFGNKCRVMRCDSHVIVWPHCMPRWLRWWVHPLDLDYLVDGQWVSGRSGLVLGDAYVKEARGCEP